MYGIMINRTDRTRIISSVAKNLQNILVTLATISHNYSRNYPIYNQDYLIYTSYIFHTMPVLNYSIFKLMMIIKNSILFENHVTCSLC